MDHSAHEFHLKTILDDLVSQGYAVSPQFLNADLVTSLRDLCLERLSGGRFREASVGPRTNKTTIPEVRNDSISWIDESNLEQAERVPLGLLLNQLEALKIALNSSLYLGLKNLEAHFACYEPGHFYKRHLDRFKSDDARTISIVLYLNENWQTSDAGCLRIYSPTRDFVDVTPQAGTLVCFRSADIEHEVLPSPTRPRLSIAGWFRR